MVLMLETQFWPQIAQSTECVLPHSEYTDRKLKMDIFILMVTQSIQNLGQVDTVCFPFVPQADTVGCR